MKKIFFSAIFIVLTASGLFAQDVKFGIRGGMNMAGMMVAKSTPISEDFDMRIAPGWGIFTELKYNQEVSFRFGVEYSGFGGKKKGMQAMPTERFITSFGNSIGMQITEEHIIALQGIAGNMPPYYYVDIDNTLKLDYVAIPLLAQVGRVLGQTPWSVYANAGPVFTFLLSGKQMSKGQSLMLHESGATIWSTIDPFAQAYIEAEFPAMKNLLSSPVPTGETNITGEMKSANFGLAGNIGIRHQRNRNSFFLEVGGNYGFFTVQDSDVNGSNRIGAVSVMLGYSFSLF